MTWLGFKLRTPRIPCEHSDYWTSKPHSRPVTISHWLIRFVPESARNHAGTGETVPLLLSGERGGSVVECRTGARGPGFETYLRRVVSLSKTLYSPKVLVNYPGSDGSVPTWLKKLLTDVKPQHNQPTNLCCSQPKHGPTLVPNVTGEQKAHGPTGIWTQDLSHCASTLTTELPSYMFDLWQFPPA